VGAGARVGFRAAQKEGVGEAGGVGRRDVRTAVADEDRAGEVEREIAGGAEQHAGAGLAVGVFALVVADAVFGVVGAEVDGVERDLLHEELGAHPVHEGVEVGLRVETARDAGLVGDDDQFVAQALSGATEGEDAGDPTDIRGVMEITDFMVNDAVAVEEESGIHRGTSSRRLMTAAVCCAQRAKENWVTRRRPRTRRASMAVESETCRRQAARAETEWGSK
jgi:hypothetical protein